VGVTLTALSLRCHYDTAMNLAIIKTPLRPYQVSGSVWGMQEREGGSGGSEKAINRTTATTTHWDRSP